MHLNLNNNQKKEGSQQNYHFAMTLLPLLLLVFASLTMALLSVYHLDWEDHVSIKIGSYLFLYGLLFFVALYQAINTLFLHTKTGQGIIRTYNLSESDVLDISNKQVSAMQALFCCITGATSITYSCPRNMLKTSHYISEAYAWFGAAYFLYDIWSMYEVYTAKIQNALPKADRLRYGLIAKYRKYLANNFVIVAHHLFIGAFGFLVITHLRGGLGDCFFGFIYLMEASTPFVSLRGILSKMGLKSSFLYVANGIVMLTTFFFCRVAMFPYVLHMYAKSVHMHFFKAVLSLPTGCLVSIAILLLPQVYWFYLMVRGATKVLGSNKKEPTTSNGTNRIKTK